MLKKFLETLLQLICFLGIIASIPIIMVSPMMFDSPNSANDLATKFLFISILLTPVILAIAMILGTIKHIKCFLIALLVPLLLGIGILAISVISH